MYESAALPPILSYDGESNKVIVQTSNKHASNNGGYIYDLTNQSITECQNLFIWYAQTEGLPAEEDMDPGAGMLFPELDDDSSANPVDETVAIPNTWRTNFITTRNKLTMLGTTTSEDTTRVEFNRWSDSPKFIWQFTNASDKFKLQTKDIDFGNPSRRKKIYKVYITFKSYGYMSGVVLKYATNGSNTFNGKFEDTTYYSNTKGFDSWNGSVINTDTGAFTTDNSTQDWITVALKPTTDLSVKNIYSLQLKFEFADAAKSHVGYSVAGTGGGVGDAIGTDASGVSKYRALSAYLTDSSGIASTDNDYYNGMPFFVYYGPGKAPDFRILDYDATSRKVILDCPTHPQLLTTDYIPATGRSYYDVGHIPKHFEVNDITIIYREKSIK